MSSHPDIDRSIRAWLTDQAPERAPGRVLDTSRDRLRTTRQRRPWWPAWRFPVMNVYAKVAIGLAALAVVAVVGFSLLPRSGTSSVGGPPSPSSSPEASATFPARDTWPSGSQIPQGRQMVRQFGIPFSFVLPSSRWGSDNEGVLGTGTFPDPSYAWMLFQQPFREVSIDPCAGTTEPIGDSIAEQAAGATRIGGTTAVGPTDVTIGGRPAKVVDLTITGEPDCELSEFWLFGNGSMYPNALDSRIRVGFVDVGGGRVLEFHSDQVGPDPALAEEIQQIIDSIRFE